MGEMYNYRFFIGIPNQAAHSLGCEVVIPAGWGIGCRHTVVVCYIFIHGLLLVPFSGQTKRRRPHSVPRKEKMLWRVQVPTVQTKVDEWK